MPKDDLGKSLAAFSFWHSPLLPGSMAYPAPSSDISIPHASHHHCSPAPDRLPPGITCMLLDASHVFRHVDSHWSLLDPPYYSPFPMLAHDDRTDSFSPWKKRNIISIDRVKPATLPVDDSASYDLPQLPCSAPSSPVISPPATSPVMPSPLVQDPSETVQPTHVTRSGRPI